MVRIILDKDSINDIPDSPAIFSLSIEDNLTSCWHVGFSNNLRESIRSHFDPGEPNINIRFLMMSEKPKILQYETENNGFTEVTKMKIKEWEQQLKPRKLLIRN